MHTAENNNDTLSLQLTLNSACFPKKLKTNILDI